MTRFGLSVPVTNGSVFSSMDRVKCSDDCPNLVHELFQRDGTWWVQFVFKGSDDERYDTIEFSLATANESLAKLRLGRLLTNRHSLSISITEVDWSASTL